MSKRLEHWFHRARAWLIAYDHAGLSPQKHEAILRRIATRFAPDIEQADPFRRRVARSVAHYFAQRSIRPKQSLVFAEVASCALLPAMLCFWLVQGLRMTAPDRPRVEGMRWLTSLLRYDVTPEVYHTPEELSPTPMPLAHTHLRYLRFADLGFLLRVYVESLRLTGVPHLQWWFKIAKEIAWVRPLLEHFPSRYALVADECNCGLSVLTEYANRHGTEIYVVQHGDLFFSVFTAFFETNRSYCWADFYVDMLQRLKAKSDFRIYQNPSFMLDAKDRAVLAEGIGVLQPSFYTLTTPEERNAFAATIRALSERYRIEIRPHPAYFHEYETMADSYGPRVTLAPAAQERCKQFALRHQLIIGTTSAAVLESLMLGREVISVEGGMVNEVAAYHFAYRMPNCTLSTLEALEQNAVRLMERPSSQAVSV